MTVTLTPEADALIRQKVEAGPFRTVDEAFRRGEQPRGTPFPP
jgi:hypothetical protein